MLARDAVPGGQGGRGRSRNRRGPAEGFFQGGRKCRSTTSGKEKGEEAWGRKLGGGREREAVARGDEAGSRRCPELVRVVRARRA